MDLRARSTSVALAVGERPVVVAALGALCIASSGVLVRLADSSPVTVAFYRCLYALPVLGLVTYLEKRRFGPLPQRTRNLAWVAGVFFATDLIFWHHAIEAVGAGLATVLGNLQVVIVGFAAWALLGERPRRELFWAIPVVLGGVVLISGVVGEDAYGANPALGVLFGVLTSLAYAAFILVLREGSRDLRRIGGPLFHATAVSAVAAALYAPLAGDVQWGPRWPEHGWLLISRSLPRLPAAVTSIVLLLQPVGAMAIAAVALGEDPALVQLAGAALILAGVVVATSGRGGRAEPAPDGPVV